MNESEINVKFQIDGTSNKALMTGKLQKKLLLYPCAEKCFLLSWLYEISCIMEKLFIIVMYPR